MTTPRLRLFGHPVHPMVVAFPLAFWVGGTAWYLFALVAPDPLWSQIGFWTLVLGLVAALPAAASGFWDLVTLPPDHPAEATGWWHMGAMSTALCCFLGSVLLHRGDLAAATPPASALVLAVVGTVVTLVGGWLGGELVFRHGVAVAGGDGGRRQEER